MSKAITTITGLENTLKKLKRAQRKYPDKDRPAKIAKFEAQLVKMKADNPKQVNAGPKIVTTGKNHANAGSVSGIKHFREWLGVFKSPKHALKM